MLYMDKKSEPKMVGSAYLHGRKFRPYKQRSQTLMATVHAEKIVLAGAIFHICMYAEGLTPKCTDQFQQELSVNDPEGSQHN